MIRFPKNYAFFLAKVVQSRFFWQVKQSVSMLLSSRLLLSLVKKRPTAKNALSALTLVGGTALRVLNKYVLLIIRSNASSDFLAMDRHQLPL